MTKSSFYFLAVILYLIAIISRLKSGENNFELVCAFLAVVLLVWGLTVRRKA